MTDTTEDAAAIGRCHLRSSAMTGNPYASAVDAQIGKLETTNVELRAQLDKAQEYCARLERVAQENFTVYRATMDTCSTLRADLDTERHQRLHATDLIQSLWRWMVEDTATIENLRENLREDLADTVAEWQQAEAWACHWQDLAERNAMKARRRKKQAAALACEVEQLCADEGFQRLERRADTLEGKVAQLTADKADWQERAGSFQADTIALAAEVERLTADTIALQANFDDAMRLYHRTQETVTALTAEIKRLNAEHLPHLDGGPVEYVTTDSDGRVVHMGRSTPPRAWVDDYTATVDDKPDSDERLSAALESDEEGTPYPSAADEINDTGETNRTTDAALKRLCAIRMAVGAEPLTERAEKKTP